MTTKSEPRWYGVSTGDGNNGVSHMFPDYYVFTDDPWELAKVAALDDLGLDAFDEAEIDGEAEHNISASVYDPDLEYCSYILDVFPAALEDVERQQADPYGKLCYGSISEAFGEESVA